MKALRVVRLFPALLLPLVAVPSSHAWGREGHMIINRLAAESLPADLPAFLHTPEAINEIEYLGPEPDRWRSRAEPELSAEQAPDHYIDLEWADVIGTLPRDRYQFIADLYAAAITHPNMAAELQPARVGFQPYITEEVWERLKAAMRDYREALTKGGEANPEVKPIEAKILFYAGWLGHYVGDGSQPLHVTINYNGWAEKENPNGYTTSHEIHWKFEGPYVAANIKAADVQPLMTPVHPIGDEWDDYMAYLRHTATFVEPLYQLDKAHGFDGAGTPEGKQFTEQRLAAGASMLRDMIAAAWTKSAEPVPQEHAGAAASAPATGMAAQLQNASQTQVIQNPWPNGIKAPVLRYAPDPEIPASMRWQKGISTVVVRFTVDPSGQPTNISVVHGLANDFDRAAVETVQKYRFTPAIYQGRPVPVVINVAVNFRVH